MTFLEARWALQLLAEERVGRGVRLEAAMEDAAFNSLPVTRGAR